MSKKLRAALIADVHVRPRPDDEMDFTFERLFESLIENKVELAVICGDTFHTKLTVSNEYFEFAVNKFRKLCDICPVIIIPGNHDLALTNPARTDSISPIVNAVNRPDRFYYSKYSESFSKFNDANVVFHHFSILDKREKWPKKEKLDLNATNIALYHGSVNNSELDNDWVSVGNVDDIDIFNGFDAAFLGDIHKFQFLTPTIAYPGSLRQNNFGETIDKGYIIWDIEDKKFESRRVVLEQKRYFFTFYLSCLDDLNEIGELPTGCRIRVKLKKEIDLAEELKIKEEIEKRYAPCNEVLFIVPDDAVNHVNITKVGNLDFIHENIRDVEVSKSLLEEYLKSKDVSEEMINKVVDLDKKYHSFVDTDVARNKTFEFKKLKWDNFLSYGKENEIDFEKLNGLVGIMGSVGTGKSSILDTMFFALHNTVFREGANKNGDYVNRKCKRSDVSLDIVDDGKTYRIDRSIKKFYSKKEGQEPRVENDVEFYTLPKQKESLLNGDVKPDTNKKIKETFGTKEDFEITTYCSQFGLTKFIDARGTERKKSLAKFFDLDVFDIKFDHAIEDHKEIKSLIKNLNKDLIVKKQEDLKKELKEKEENYEAYKVMRVELDALYKQKEEEYEKLSNSIVKVSIVEDLDKLNKELDVLQDRLKTEDEMYRTLSKEVESNFKKYNLNFEEVVKLMSRFQEKAKEIFGAKSKLVVLKKKAELINNIPAVEVCKTCILAKDAYASSEEYDTLIKDLSLLEEEFKKFEQAQIQQSVILKEQDALDDVKDLLQKIKKVEDKIAASNSNKDAIEQNKKIEEHLLKLKQEKNKLYLELCDVPDVDLLISISSLKKQIEDNSKQIKKARELSASNDVYSLYLDAIGKNGISYWIISKKLGHLTKLTNQILSRAVQWKFSVENNEEEKSIRFYISDEKGKRIAELASGGEKTILSLALRASLWKLCLLPKSNMLILDESLSFLDDEHLDATMKLLKYLKTEFFKKIIVITHNQELKKEMDSFIYIDKNKGFAQCVIK